MSLSIEIRVNGHPVATLVASNIGPNQAPGEYKYDGMFSHFTADSRLETGRVEVVHRRANGILALAAKLLGEAA